MSNIQFFEENKLYPNFCRKEIKEIKNFIDRSISFCVVGMPALGVSFFLKYIAVNKLGFMVHIDLNSLVKKDRESFFVLLLKELGGKAKKDADYIKLCQDRLQKLIAEEERIVIILNHFDRLSVLIDKDFLSNIRSLTYVDREKIVLITTANKPLPELFARATSGGNLNLYSTTFYLKPFLIRDLKKLANLTQMEKKYPAKSFARALTLSGGHYQLFQLLVKSQFLFDNPLSDPAVRLNLKQNYDERTYEQKKMLQNIVLGKEIKKIDPALIALGYVTKKDKGYELFTPLFADYISLNIKINLPVLETKLLNLLKKNLNRVISHDQIYSFIWPNGEGSDWALKSLIYRIRKNPKFLVSGYTIESLKKQGYMLVKNR